MGRHRQAETHRVNQRVMSEDVDGGLKDRGGQGLYSAQSNELETDRAGSVGLEERKRPHFELDVKRRDHSNFKNRKLQDPKMQPNSTV